MAEVVGPGEQGEKGDAGGDSAGGRLDSGRRKQGEGSSDQRYDGPAAADGGGACMHAACVHMGENTASAKVPNQQVGNRQGDNEGEREGCEWPAHASVHRYPWYCHYRFLPQRFSLLSEICIIGKQ